MMKIKIIIYLIILSIWVNHNDVLAQTPGSNPIFTNAWTADPAPMVYNGRMYVYVGHDEATGNQLYNITGWLCYSTADMKTWTYHGQVLKPTDFSWSTGEAWASQVVEQNGKFYYYVCCQAGGANTGKAIGVAVSNSPTGPFVDARGTALVYDKTTPSSNAWDDIDPTILKDDDGSVYMVWGNPNCYFAKLKPNMIEIDGAIKTITPPNYAEGPWLHKRNGIYYLTYAAFVPGVGSEQICYATASNINGPWTYKGVLSGTAKNSYTIHPGIIEYNNQWYLFYHNATLTINGVGPTTGRRSVCVDYLCYNTDGTMKPVTQTTSGVSGSSPCPSSPVPVVSITAPTNNTVYTEGDNVTLTATATITTGSISKVDFYNGTTLLGTDVSSPYTYTITAAAGNYAITAKATSALNAATTSTAINIQVAKPIYQTGTAPAIDGTVDALWSNFQPVSISKTVSGTVSSAADLSGNWKAMWDATNLYVLVQVTDDVKRNDAGTDVYNDDNVEVYVDMGNSKATTYGSNNQQYTFRWNDATAAYEINGHSVTGITKGITNTATGYIVEVSIRWSTMGGTASVNAIEGFDVMINDDDDGAARDGKMAWSATADDTWSNPSLMGTVILKGLNCSVPTAAITTTTPTAFCAGGSVTLTATTGTGYSYVWKNGTTTITGATAASYTATTAGSYTVIITNSGGCSATSAATAVTVNALPIISQYAQIDGGAWNQTNTAMVCAGSTVVLGPQPSVTAGWSWTGPNGYSATTREITLAGLTPTQGGVYTATYTDGNTCKATSIFTLTVNATAAAPAVTASVSYCQNATAAQLTAIGTNLKWYTIAAGGTALVNAPTPATGVIGTTNYYVSQTKNTCESTRAVIAVTVNPIPTAAITTTTLTTFCQGQSVVLTASTGSSYLWKNGTAQIGTRQTYIATTAGSYTVEVTNAGSCKATSAATTVTISAAATAAITTTTPTTFCAGGSVVLTANSGSSYKWMNGTAAITGATAQSYTAATAGSYTVEVTNAGSCKATSAATTVTVNPLPTATITANGPTAIPHGGNVVLTASVGISYTWFKGSTQVGTDQSYTATVAGVYIVEVTNTNNCSSTSAGTNVNINTNQPSIITITSPTANATFQGSVTITANVMDPDGTIVLVEYLDGNTLISKSTTAPYSFDWNNPGEGDHTITVRVTDSNGGITTSAPVIVTSAPLATGVQSSNRLDASIYPNPSTGDVYIDTDIDLSNASFILVDVLGRELTVSSVVTGSGARIDVSNLNAGTYVFMISYDGLILRKKITIVR